MNATKASPSTQAASSRPIAHGVGRRKTSVARVWLRHKKQGNVVVNGRDADTYFDTESSRDAYKLPFTAVSYARNYDIQVNVCGGGIRSQADAVKLAIARALVSVDEEVKGDLREYGLLTVDPRQKERKKYGQRGARRKFQFVKR